MMNKIKTIIANTDYGDLLELKRYIGKLDYVDIVAITRTGEETYNKIIELKPEIVFTRYNMGDMDAIRILEETSKQLKEKTPMFKFIAKDLLQKENKTNYKIEENSMNSFVKELGKKGIVEVLEKYKEVVIEDA